MTRHQDEIFVSLLVAVLSHVSNTSTPILAILEALMFSKVIMRFFFVFAVEAI